MFYGKYRGKVVKNDDPLKRGRIMPRPCFHTKRRSQTSHAGIAGLVRCARYIARVNSW